MTLTKEQAESLSKAGRKREVLISSLTRFGKFIASQSIGPNSPDLQLIRVKLEKTEKLWGEFDEVQTEIEYLKPNEPNDKRAKFEDEYCEFVSKARALLQTQKMDAISSRSSSHGETSVKLPDLKLPSFDGKYEDYQSFKEEFKSIIDSRDDLVPVQRFRYLKGCLKGDANAVLKGMEVTNINYKLAWDTLDERFDNKRRTVATHIKAIIECDKVEKSIPFKLQNMLDTLSSNLRCLTSLGLPTEHWDTILIHILVKKLDTQSRQRWEQKGKKSELPTLAQFVTFLQERVDVLETLDEDKTPTSKTQSSQKSKALNTQNSPTQEKAKYEYTLKCSFCNKNHKIYFCRLFKALSVPNRKQEVAKLGLCTMCLIPHTDVDKCPKYTCRICSKLHNSLLHSDEEPQTECSSASTCALAPNCSTKPKVLLSTAIVHIKKPDGTIEQCRILLDSGSQSNFVSSATAKLLGFPLNSTKHSICGIGGEVAGSLNFSMNCSIKSRYEPFETNLEFLVIPKITLPVPESPIDTSKWDIPPDLFLADPEFAKPQKVDMLIGAELFYCILKGDQRSLGKDMPRMQHTNFGWVIGGKLKVNRGAESVSLLSVNTCTSLDENLRKFWEVEEGFLQPRYTAEEKACEKLFTETTIRDETGRFIVQLPKNEKFTKLGESKFSACRRFLNLEKRLDKNPQLKTSYSAFMDEYSKLGHMELVRDEDLGKPNYYLPHHCVTNADSSTTKLRVVFDGSAKTSSGVSLNETLMNGPTIQEDLISIIIRFRKHRFVLTADITKMYRQIKVHEDDKHLQRIIWRENTDQPLQEFCLNTVTYGTTPASFLATRCLQRAAEESCDEFPNSTIAINQDFFMDDYLGGHDDLCVLEQTKFGIISILERAGMELHKWCSNEPKLLASIPKEKQEAKYIPDDKDVSIKTLGLWWNPTEDHFKFSVKIGECSDQITKRMVLSDTARIFDPLGLIGPVIVKAKMFLQSLWSQKLDWDENLKEDDQNEWKLFRKDLQVLESLRIPRQVLHSDHSVYELHGFSDSSELAYGASIYVRTLKPNHSKNYCQLLISKSRVAPVKKLSLPRLELCGALLLSKLYEKVKNAIQIDFSRTILWSDSTIVLAWINSPSAQWKTFVSNRVSEIHDLTISCEWRHVRTHDNPADKVSRGLSPSQIFHDNLWWNGPTWLTQNSVDWPTQPISIEINEEKRSNALVSIVKTPIINWDRFSSFSKIIRVIILVKRFIKLRLGKINHIPRLISCKEYRDAEKSCILRVQMQSFQHDLKNLSRDGEVHCKSSLRCLSPFLDKDGFLRVGGRIQKSPLSYDQKHQIILPGSHPVTKLLMAEEHKRQLHAGPQLLLATIRQRFWPLNARNLARGVTQSCILCYRNKPKPQSQLMGELPQERLTTTRPFWNTGVDYCGPINIKASSLRNARSLKAYIAIFVCLAVKAIHIELVGDLSAQSFVAALSRFVARRGKPQLLVSDNGTNFTGAKKILHQEFIKVTQEERVAAYIAPENMEWKFIPPYSPEFGGLWERAVQSFKYHYKRICGDKIYTYEETYTYLAMVESCLNSRPLTSLNSDPNDLSPLTPGHFIIGNALNVLPQAELQDVRLPSLTRWHRVQQMFQAFWSRFAKEYIADLQVRSKNLKKMPNLKPGQLVLVKGEDLPPLKWPLGRILATHPGSDGIIRVVTVKTASGIYKRNITKICPLPIPEERDLEDPSYV